jgi:hypothetical protein
LRGFEVAGCSVHLAKHFVERLCVIALRRSLGADEQDEQNEGACSREHQLLRTANALPA